MPMYKTKLVPLNWIINYERTESLIIIQRKKVE